MAKDKCIRDASIGPEEAERFLDDNNLKNYREGVNFLLEKLGEGDAQ